MPDPEEHVYEDLMSGVACFFGSRVPVSYLFEGLAAGESIEDFLTAYPHIPESR